MSDQKTKIPTEFDIIYDALGYSPGGETPFVYDAGTRKMVMGKEVIIDMRKLRMPEDADKLLDLDETLARRGKILVLR